MISKEMILVRNTSSVYYHNMQYVILEVIDETPDGWVLAGYKNQENGAWFSPKNVIRRWCERVPSCANDNELLEKFDYNSIDNGSIVVVTHGLKELSKKIVGIVIERKGGFYSLLWEGNIIDVPWEVVRPLNTEID